MIERLDRYRHVASGGLYDLLALAQDAANPDRSLAVYRSVENRAVLVRPAEEFNDGFALLASVGAKSNGFKCPVCSCWQPRLGSVLRRLDGVKTRICERCKS